MSNTHIAVTQTGLIDLITQAGPVAKVVLLFLLGASVFLLGYHSHEVADTENGSTAK